MANILTLLRVLLVPVVVLAMLSPVPGGRLTAAALFGVAALTDLFDGMVARRTGSVTEFGKIADPLADRALILVILATLVYRGDLPLWAAATVVGRDAAMMIGYRLMQRRGDKPEVSLAGKAATAVLMISISLLVLELPGARLAFYAGVMLSLGSGVLYAGSALGRRPQEGPD